MLKIKVILFVLFISALLQSNCLMAQYVQGNVFEISGKDTIPLAGVNVYWSGSQKGTTSDTNGFFRLQAMAESHELVFSFVGFENDTLHVHHGNRINHVMRKPVQLIEVEVSSRAQTQFVSRMSTVNTVKITRGELQRAACCNLSESFETSASVNVNYSDAVTGAKQIEMLGLSGVYTQMMSENIPNLRGLASSFGLLYIPGSWMESIQVSKGTSSVLNGFESITGQINVEYKKPHQSERFFLNFFQAHTGRSEANSNVRVKVMDKLSTMLLGHYSQNVTSHDANKDGFLDDPLYNQVNFFNRWDFNDEKFEFQFGLKGMSETRKGGQMAFDQSRLPSDQPNLYGIRIENDRMEAFLKTGFIFSRPATSLGIQQQFVSHRLNSDFGLRSYYADEQTYYLNALFQSFIGDTRHNYTAGVSLLYEKMRGLGEFGTEHLRTITPGLFYQYTYSDGSRLNLIVGIRADRDTFKGLFFTSRLHARYNLSEHTIVRASAGKGYRRPRIIAENLSLLASSKSFQWIGDPKNMLNTIEEAWNYGFNISQYVHIAGREMVINFDAYRTQFVNQLVVDRLSHARVMFYKLNGKSYSNSFQLETQYELFRRLATTLAFRYNDVKIEYQTGLCEKPLINRYKGLLSMSYQPNVRWQFDMTGLVNGPSFIPEWARDPSNDQFDAYAPVYFTANAQLTRNFRKWSLYLGGENLTNYTQHQPIFSAANPFDPAFDASVIWGPLMGTKIYAGLRYTVE